MEVNLRSVECSVSFIDYIRKSQIIQRTAKCVCCHFPIFVTSHTVFRTCGQFYMIFKSKQTVNFIDQSCNAFDLVLDLIRCHKDMRIILCEAAHSHQTMKLSWFFMTVNQSQLSHTDRKISVGTRLRLICQDSSRTVHRFDCKVFLIDHSCIHILFVMIPVSRCLPEMTA